MQVENLSAKPRIIFLLVCTALQKVGYTPAGNTEKTGASVCFFKERSLVQKYRSIFHENSSSP
jgi:hypothetical protein